jgi:hypothetical protein
MYKKNFSDMETSPLLVKGCKKIEPLFGAFEQGGIFNVPQML